MADFPVAAALVASGARQATATQAGVSNADTVSISLPATFVKTANPLPLSGVDPRYKVLALVEGGTAVVAASFSYAWSAAAPEIVATCFVAAGNVDVTFVVENLHSEVS